MNEIAAIVTIIFFTESVAPGSQEEKDVNSSNVSQKYLFYNIIKFFLYIIYKRTIDLFKFLNDETYAEADIFSIFDKIMKIGQQEMFRPNTEDPNNPNTTINHQ